MPETFCWWTGDIAVASSLHYAAQHKAWTTVRLNTQQGITLRKAGQAGHSHCWKDLNHCSAPERSRCGRWKSLLRIAHLWRRGSVLSARAMLPLQPPSKKLQRKSTKQGNKLQPQTLVYAEYVMVLTTWPEDRFPAGLVLEWYRFRWQIELVFKRFKQIAELGHLPGHHDDSAKAWLYRQALGRLC